MQFRYFFLISFKINDYSNIIAMEMYIDGVEAEASMTSSTGSNYVFIDEGPSDKTSSNSPNQLDFQSKAHRFILFLFFIILINIYNCFGQLINILWFI